MNINKIDGKYVVALPDKTIFVTLDKKINLKWLARQENTINEYIQNQN